MRTKIKKRNKIKTDPLYKSRLVTRMINKVMWGGKKSIAEDIVYGVLERLSEDRKEATELFEEAVKNVMPEKEVRTRRVGGANYQVPYPVTHDRSEALAVRWMVEAARSKSGKPMVDRLFEEVKDAHEGIGSAINKKESVHKMAESNRAFSHLRF